MFIIMKKGRFRLYQILLKGKRARIRKSPQNLLCFRITQIRLIPAPHVVTLVDGVETPGIKAVEWDGVTFGGAPAASGVYFYVLYARPVGGYVCWFDVYGDYLPDD